MTSSVDVAQVPPWEALSVEQAARWGQVLDTIAALVPAGRGRLVVDGNDGGGRNEHGGAGVVADRIAVTMRGVGRHCLRLRDREAVADEDAWYAEAGEETVGVADGARWRAHPVAGRWSVLV